MAVTLGLNAGFCTAVPTVDPLGTALTFDTRAYATKDTSPPTANRIVKVFLWIDNASEEVNIEVGVFSDDATNEPHLRLLVKVTNPKGTTAGYKEFAVDWTISPNVVYWISGQCDNTATTTSIDVASSGGSGYATKNTVTELPADWGTSTVTDTDGVVAIGVVWAEAAAADTGDFMFMFGNVAA